MSNDLLPTGCNAAGHTPEGEPIHLEGGECPAHDAETLECLDGPEGCVGAVEYRMALSATGKPFPRCDGHWEKRLGKQDEIARRYPDSPTPPAWFDPSYAGEQWDEDR